MFSEAVTVAVVGTIGAATGSLITGYLKRGEQRVDDGAKFRMELLDENRQLRADIDRVSDQLVKERETRSKQEAECVKRIAALESRLARLERSGDTPPHGTPTQGGTP